jgi:nucleoside phosphorylase
MDTQANHIDILITVADGKFEHCAVTEQIKRAKSFVKRQRSNLEVRLNVDIYDFKNQNDEVVYTLGLYCLHRFERSVAGQKVGRLLQTYNPSALILCGTAGSMAPSVASHGSVVIGNQIDQITIDKAVGYEQRGTDRIIRSDRQRVRSLPIRSGFLNLFWDASKNVPEDEKHFFDPLSYALLDKDELEHMFQSWRERTAVQSEKYGEEYLSKVQKRVHSAEIQLNIGAYVSSPAFIADPTLRDAWRTDNDDRLCLDQEAGLIGSAVEDHNEQAIADGRTNSRCDYIVIKSIADLSDGNSDPLWMFIASSNAAAIAMGSIYRRGPQIARIKELNVAENVVNFEAKRLAKP